MTAPGGGGLEGRIAELEKAIRSLMATNWTDRASVVDAAGNAVTLSNLAFGQVSAYVSGFFTLQGPAGAAQPVNSTDYTPAITVYVAGGRLRVDWSANLQVSTQGGLSAILTMSVTAQGPYPDQASADAAAPGISFIPGSVFGGPTPYRYSPQGGLIADAEGTTGSINLSAGMFGLLTGLPKGFYRVFPNYRLDYDASNNAAAQPSGLVRRRTIAAQPF